jgi:hypothetical protein
MRKLLLVGLLVLALGSSARAAIELTVLNKSGAPGSTGSFDVYLVETPPDTVLSAWNVGFKLSSGGTVSITNIVLPSGSHPAVFGANLQSRYSTPALAQGSYVAGRDEFVGDSGANTGIVNNSKDGLFAANYSVAPGATPGTVINFTIDPAKTFFFDGNGDPLAFTTNLGSFTVTPEPTALGLALLGLPLIMRRRR